MTGTLSGFVAFGGVCAAAEGDPAASSATPQTVVGWLDRLRAASSIPRYVGTYVVTSDTGSMSSARIWHRAANGEFSERVDTLSGRPRTIFRHDSQVNVIIAEAHVVRTDAHRLGLGFPNLSGIDSAALAAKYYTVRARGQDRIAGLIADVVQFQPRDDLRFAYRVWSERRTGLMIKSQIIDKLGYVLEQASFSELDLDPPADWVDSHLEMPSTDGYEHESVVRTPIDIASAGWALNKNVPGFESQGSYEKSVAGEQRAVQWLFSDGLATVSLFLEPYDPKRHMHPGTAAFGATHALRRRWPDDHGAWWVASVGEVPGETLVQFVDGLSRTTPGH